MLSKAALLACLSSLICTAAAACSSNLVIDNYTKWSTHTNSLGEWTGDDSSMTSISKSGTKLLFTPKTDGSSYFYTSFACIDTATLGYNAITFPIKAPKAASSLVLEIQTSVGCTAAYTSRYYVVSGLGTTTTTVTVPLSKFGTGSVATTAFLWSSLTSGAWELGETSFVCSAGTTTGIVASTSTTSSTKASSSTSTVAPSATTTSTKPSVTTTPTGTCSPLLIDDWASQSRLTFLYYNAMLEPSSDDATMTSVVVKDHRLTLTSTSSGYFFSQFNCVAATNKYGGISLRIKAAAGVKLSVQLESSTNCVTSTTTILKTSTQLGWTFDGTEKLYSIPFSLFAGVDLSKLSAVLFTAQTGVLTLGPMQFYCGSTVAEYIVPTTTTTTAPVVTVPATTATATAFVIDQFASSSSNALGFWHGGDDDTGLSYASGKLTIKFTDPDFSYYTQVTATCRDMTTYNSGYIHIAYTGSTKFSIALQQHNSACDDTISPYPETWDEVYASTYASGGNIYVPIAHFNIIKTRVIGIALKGFANDAPTVLSKIEIVKSIPAGFTIPAKIPTAELVFACTRPNSFAFAIDDGTPEYAQQVLATIKAAGIKVTFFTVGAPLLDPSTNLSNVYNEMYAEGHQIALHSFTHPKMEGLAEISDIDWEIDNDIAAVKQTLGLSPTYFRPPFGTTGARFRQRIAAKLGPTAKIINWSVDVQDWLWGTSSTPEKQLTAFSADLAKGGNLVVMHYLYPSTVGYLAEFIKLAKATGKTLMRVDQCMMDPNAPPL